MLNFAEMDAPSLPVHDSFICHHGYAETGEIEETMRKAFFEEMGEHISKVDTEILSWTYYQDESASKTPTFDNVFDEVMHVIDEFAQWEKRHEIWYKSKQK